MTYWKKRYSESYQKLKAAFPSRFVELINAKEEIIVSSPTTNPFLKHKFINIRRYKAGKIRIIYCLSTERIDMWENEPAEPEVMFIYVRLKSNNTYDDAYKYLNQAG